MNNKIMKSGLAAMMAASLVGCSSSSSDNSNNVLTVWNYCTDEWCIFTTVL